MQTPWLFIGLFSHVNKSFLNASHSQQEGKGGLGDRTAALPLAFGKICRRVFIILAQYQLFHYSFPVAEFSYIICKAPCSTIVLSSYDGPM